MFTSLQIRSDNASHYIQILLEGHSDVERLGDYAPSWLPATAPVEMAVIYYDKRGVKRVKGGKHLKSSQSYPLPFLCWEVFLGCWICVALMFLKTSIDRFVDNNQLYDVGEMKDIYI